MGFGVIGLQACEWMWSLKLRAWVRSLGEESKGREENPGPVLEDCLQLKTQQKGEAFARPSK